MAEGPETAGRSLADILREAGIENPSSKSGRRRRWDDLDDTGIRQRGPDAGRSASAPGAAYGRRASDLPLDRPADAGRRETYPRREADLRRTGERRRDEEPPRSSRFRDEAPVREEHPPRQDRAPREDRPPRQERAPREDRPGRQDRAGRQDRPPREERQHLRTPAAEPSTAAIPGLRASRQPSVPGAAAAVEAPPRERRGSSARTPQVGPAPATGPIPAVTDEVRELPDDAGPRESALAWLRFAGELVIAAAVGVGIYFLFTVLWQTLPHVAVVVAPLAVTGLVAGVSVWRQRFGHAQLGPRLLAVLVFAGTLLTVLPVAGLVSGG
jgi:hypothetical protein